MTAADIATVPDQLLVIVIELAHPIEKHSQVNFEYKQKCFNEGGR